MKREAKFRAIHAKCGSQISSYAEQTCLKLRWRIGTCDSRLRSFKAFSHIISVFMPLFPNLEVNKSILDQVCDHSKEFQGRIPFLSLPFKISER